jgi:hypothetical protein
MATPKRRDPRSRPVPTNPLAEAARAVEQLPADGEWYEIMKTPTAKRADNIAQELRARFGPRIEAMYDHDDEAEPNRDGSAIRSVVLVRKYR